MTEPLTPTPDLQLAADGQQDPVATIVVVDDEPAVRRSTARILRRCGFRALEADSGEDALRLLDGEGSDARLVLSDVVMPGMSGFALAERLEKVRPDIAVLLLSGYTPTALERHAFGPGSRAQVLEKPIELEELTDRIRATLSV